MEMILKIISQKDEGYEEDEEHEEVCALFLFIANT